MANNRRDDTDFERWFARKHRSKAGALASGFSYPNTAAIKEFMREGWIARAALAAPAAPQAGEDARQKCWCESCRPITMTDMRMVLCPTCGNKRCPHAANHRNACTSSNEPGQKGSSYEHCRPPEEDARPVAWAEAETIANIPAVDEALEAFSNDSTFDNAVGIVQAVISASQPAAQAAPAVPDDGPKPVFVLPPTVARIVRNVFLPANPNKLRKAHPDTVAAAKHYIEALEAFEARAALTTQGASRG